MMAAFIIAINGTVKQAVMLGVSATISHSFVVWVIAFFGVYFFGGKFNAQITEPYFQLASGFIMVAIALWILHRTWRHHNNFKLAHSHHHHHDHDHKLHELSAVEIVSPEYQDAHELAHAQDINKRFADRKANNWQIILFGLTGGLIPCPASITVLLICLQLKKIALGALLVLCFSIGLALTMVAAGTIAALSIHHVKKRWSGFSMIARRAPYLSGAIILLIGIYVIYHGFLAF
jgi:ABC-type nickel/cobalt efflux system permease component RcnA